MSSAGKNIMVGLTMLVGLILLGVLLMKFGAAPAALFGAAKIPVEMHVARADGLNPGSSVNYLGVNVGQVTGVRQSADGTEVIVAVGIDSKNAPPANVVGRIRSQIVGGGSNVSLEIPDGKKPEGKIQAKAVIPATFLGVDLLPPEIGQLAAELKLTSKQLRDSKVIEHLDQTIQTVNVQLQKAGKLMDAVDNTVGDAKLQENIRASVANVRTATESANRIAANLEKFSTNLDQIGKNFNDVTVNANKTITNANTHIDELTRQVDGRMLQVAKLLDQFQSITAKIDAGKGTAGMLVNDAKLYEGLVDSSKELTLTLRDLKLLVEQIREEGFHFNLGKK